MKNLIIAYIVFLSPLVAFLWKEASMNVEILMFVLITPLVCTGLHQLINYITNQK